MKKEKKERKRIGRGGGINVGKKEKRVKFYGVKYYKY